MASELGIAMESFDALDTGKHRKLRDTQAGCFLSHYRLWLRCVELDEPICVFEHDIILVEPVPAIEFLHVVNLLDSHWNDPQWRFYRKMNKRLLDRSIREDPGALGLVDARFMCLPSTGAYAVTPGGAKRLISVAHERGALPADIFISKGCVDIRDLKPFPATGNHSDSASTVGPSADWEGFWPGHEQD